MNRLLGSYDRLMNIDLIASPYDGLINIAKETGNDPKMWIKRREDWLESRGIVKMLKETLRRWLENHDPEDWWKFASEEGARLAEKLHFGEVDPDEDWVKTQVANYKRLYPFPKEVLNGN